MSKNNKHLKIKTITVENSKYNHFITQWENWAIQLSRKAGRQLLKEERLRPLGEGHGYTSDECGVGIMCIKNPPFTVIVNHRISINRKEINSFLKLAIVDLLH